jgi:hypothetical protein
MTHHNQTKELSTWFLTEGRLHILKEERRRRVIQWHMRQAVGSASEGGRQAGRWGWAELSQMLQVGRSARLEANG